MSESRSLRTCLAIAALLLLLLAGLALRGSFMETSLGNLFPTSDECMQALQAKYIAQGERPLLYIAQPYQFPLGSYLMSPVIMHTARDTLGARWPTFILGTLTFLFLCLICRELGPLKQNWPAWLLVCLPSAYLMLFQSAYAPPNHDTMLFLLTLGLFMLIHGRNKLEGAVWPWFTAGAACLGLSLSVHLVGAGLVCFSVLLCCRHSWRRSGVNVLAWAGGLALGLIPFILAVLLLSDSYGAVTTTRPLSWLYEGPLTAGFWGTLHGCLSGVLGFAAVTYIDTPQYVPFLPWLPGLTPWFFWPLIISLTGLCLWRLTRAVLKGRVPELGLAEVCCLAMWANILMFLLNTRAFSSTHRYLLVVGWSLPFAVAGLYQAARLRPLKFFLGMMAVLLAIMNLGNMLSVKQAWQEPGFSALDAETPDIQPVIDYMDAHGLKHGLSDHWTSYRIPYHTDERLIVSQVYNERFPGYPIPYLAEASQDPEAIYIFRTNQHRTPDFARTLNTCAVQAQTTQAGGFTIFHNFKAQYAETGLLPSELRGSSPYNGANLTRLWDDDPETYWDSKTNQEKGMALEIWLGQAQPLSRITLDYGYGHNRWPNEISLQYWNGGVWADLPEIRAGWDGCRFTDHKLDFTWPLLSQTIRFSPVLTQGLKVIIQDPRTDREWSLKTIQVYKAD